MNHRNFRTSGSFGINASLSSKLHYIVINSLCNELDTMIDYYNFNYQYDHAAWVDIVSKDYDYKSDYALRIQIHFENCGIATVYRLNPSKRLDLPIASKKLIYDLNDPNSSLKSFAGVITKLTKRYLRR